MTTTPASDTTQGATVAAPVGHPGVPWHTVGGVTVHDGVVHVRFGFSEQPLRLADALVFTAEVLEAFGYTYSIHRVDDLAGSEVPC